MNPMNTPEKTTASPQQAAKQKAMLPIPKERILHQIQRSPFIDWLIILAVGTVIAVILVGVGVSVYLDTGTRLSAPPSNAPRSAALPLNNAVLQKVLTKFDGREAERADIIRSYSAPSDPSLP